MRNNIDNIILKTAKAIYDNEKFPVGVLAVRAQRAAEANPMDQTIVAMSNFLARKQTSASFISRSELKEVYSKLYTTNNKFAELFSSELGKIGEESTVKRMVHSESEGKNLMKEAYSNMADPVLSNALTAVFDKTAQYKPYSASLGTLAAKTCLQELNRFAEPRKIDVVAGQEDLIICQATYDTPKGQTAVFVPVEIKHSRALLPTVFLGRAGFEDLSKTALETHLIETAGKSFKVNAWEILSAVSRIKNGEQNKLSEFDVIVAKTKLAQGKPEMLQNAVLYQEVDPAKVDLETPVHEDTEKFASRLASVPGSAEMIFGKNAVERSRNLVVKSLRSFGYDNSNVSLVDHDKSSLYFAVSVDNQVAFKVPVKIASNNPQTPAFVLSSGRMFDFSRHGISNLLATEDVDTGLLAKASPLYNLKSSELIATVAGSMADGKHYIAEDALTVLSQSGDVASYKMALVIYKDGLNGKVIKNAEEVCKCSMQRKAANSKYVICGHTNMPTHKVYQDEHGNCQPLYRKYIAEPEGGSFLHTKVYFG